jgi:type IV secretion system protein VirB11
MLQRSNALTLERTNAAFRHALGSLICEALEDERVIEISVNPDGRIWIDRAGEPSAEAGCLTPDQTAQVIRFVATQMSEVVNDDHPHISGVLPTTGDRFQGVLPPLAAGPAFSIRKRAVPLYTLEDYVRDEIMSDGQRQRIATAVERRENILVAGGTASGKTTLTNAILALPAFQRYRVVILEDTPELRCGAPNSVSLLTKEREPRVTMTHLVKMTLRMKPDRIIVGEVRDGAALDMVQAWNTGHPGGVCTLHANSARDALQRLEDLIGLVSARIPRRAIAGAIDCIVFIENGDDGRRVKEIARVTGVDGDSYQLA